MFPKSAAMKLFFFLIVSFSALQIAAQTDTSKRISKIIFDGITYDLNDTTCLRILDGIMLSGNYVVRSYGEFKYIQKGDSKLEQWISTAKPVMIINSKRPPIEFYVDSVLYNSMRLDTLPYYVNLPMVINGALVIGDDKTMLDKIKASDIEKIEYKRSAKISSGLFLDAPFGVIEVTLKKK